MLTRRMLLSTPLAAIAANAASAASGKMTLPFIRIRLPGRLPKSLEGWSRAGIKHVESPTGCWTSSETDSRQPRAASHRPGLTPVSCA